MPKIYDLIREQDINQDQRLQKYDEEIRDAIDKADSPSKFKKEEAENLQ